MKKPNVHPMSKDEIEALIFYENLLEEKKLNQKGFKNLQQLYIVNNKLETSGAFWRKSKSFEILFSGKNLEHHYEEIAGTWIARAKSSANKRADFKHWFYHRYPDKNGLKKKAKV